MKPPAVPVLILATRNAHKVAEIAAILGPRARCVSLREFPGAPEAVEDADTFAGNAACKAVSLARWLQATGAAVAVLGDAPGWVMADDSGLEVDALNGAPGVHSARFAALATGRPGNSPDAENNARLLQLMSGVPANRRTARFRCALALVPWTAPGEAPLRFEGACPGRLLDAPSGSGGFGYDPLFIPDGFDRTFGELGEAVKNSLSHRARALAELVAWLERRAASVG